jgi:hypothetical protein
MFVAATACAMALRTRQVLKAESEVMEKQETEVQSATSIQKDLSRWQATEDGLKAQGFLPILRVLVARKSSSCQIR